MGEIHCITHSSPGRPGESVFSLIGDYGWPRVPRDNLSLSSRGRAEQWPVCPLMDDFFCAPGHVNGTSQVFPTERQSSWPYDISYGYGHICKTNNKAGRIEKAPEMEAQYLCKYIAARKDFSQKAVRLSNQNIIYTSFVVGREINEICKKSTTNTSACYIKLKEELLIID